MGARLRGQPLFIVAKKARSDLGRSFPKPELVWKEIVLRIDEERAMDF